MFEVLYYPTYYSLLWTQSSDTDKDDIYHLPTYPQNIQPHGNVLNCPVIMPSKKVV